MEGKVNNESDGFKKTIRNHLKEEAIHSSTDAQIWEKVLQEIQPEVPIEAKTTSLYRYAIAAILLLSFGISYIVWKYQANTPQEALLQHSVQKQPQIQPAHTAESLPVPKQPTSPEKPTKKDPANRGLEQRMEVISTVDKIRIHKLPDGSLVTLNTDTYLSAPYSFGKTREVSIHGEAYFEIIPDKSKPFIVHFDNYSLEVVGTKFSVRNVKEEETKEVTVTEGLVKVYENKEGPTFVKAGEQLKLHQTNASVRSHVDALNFISWKTNVLSFKNSKLEEVVKILMRVHKQEIHLGTTLKNCVFTGDLSELPLDEALEVVKLSSNLKIEKKYHKIYITGQGCD